MDFLSVLLGVILGNLIWVNYQIQTILSEGADEFHRFALSCDP